MSRFGRPFLSSSVAQAFYVGAQYHSLVRSMPLMRDLRLFGTTLPLQASSSFGPRFDLVLCLSVSSGSAAY